MTRKDYILIAECVAECYNEKHNLQDTISTFIYYLHLKNSKFDPTNFKEFIYERTKPDYIPDEQRKQWAKAKSKK